MNKHILISSIGWEPRFLLGLKAIFSTNPSLSSAILIHSTLFIERTTEPLNEAESICKAQGIEPKVINLDPNAHVSTWNLVSDALKNLTTTDEVTLDITTMPRHLIWACLHFLEKSKVIVHCIYYRPQSYGPWLSGDNGKPKLVFRHSGIAYPDRATCLLLFSGFDTERTNQIVDAFEPAKIILITQIGEQLDNEIRCVKEIHRSSDIVTARLDAYSDIEDLRSSLEELVKPEIDTFNVIATTVGPRCSTIALYALNRTVPEIGLLYANSHLYNCDYSFGIDLKSRFYSTIDFRSI